MLSQATERRYCDRYQYAGEYINHPEVPGAILPFGAARTPLFGPDRQLSLPRAAAGAWLAAGGGDVVDDERS